MGKDDIMRDETSRDIVAARAEIVGRRDQVTAEYDDRLAALEQLTTELEAGEMAPKAAQTKIRRILGGDRSVTTARKAGRTKIGMTVPTARPTQAPPKKSSNQRSGPSATRAHVAVTRILGQIDQRIIHNLRVARETDARAEARLELSLLLRLRRGLESYIDEMPTDVILLTSVVESTEHAESAVGDLETGGSDRVKRLLEHNRSMVSELLALGAAVGTIKDQIIEARGLLEDADDNLRPVLGKTLAAFAQLQDALDKQLPVNNPSMLDELVRA